MNNNFKKYVSRFLVAIFIVSAFGSISPASATDLWNIIDGYGCDSTYCVYHPWYAATQTYVKNGSTGGIVYSGQNANSVISSLFSALNSGDIVRFESGTYDTSTGTHLTLTASKITLQGGYLGTTIYNSAGTALEITGQGNNIKDIAFASDGTTAGVSALLLTNSHRNKFENVRLEGGYYGLWLKGSLINEFYGLIGTTNIAGTAVSAPTNAWIYSNTSNALSSNANRFYGLTLEGGSGGVIFQGTAPYPAEGGNSIYGCTIEGIAGTAVDITGSSQPTMISGCHFEANTLDISVTNAWGITVENSILKNANVNSGKGVKFENDVVLNSLNNYGASDVYIDSPTLNFYNINNNIFTGAYNGITTYFAADNPADITSLYNLLYSNDGIVQSTDTTLFHFNGGSRTAVFRIDNKGATELFVSHIARNSADSTTRWQNVSYSADGSSYTSLYNIQFAGADATGSGTIITAGKYTYIKITQSANYALKWIGVYKFTVTPNVVGIATPPDLSPTNFGSSATPPSAYLAGDTYRNSTKAVPNLCTSTAAGTANWVYEINGTAGC